MHRRIDRIQQAGSVTYTVNANGNLVSRGADTFGYDQANRLITATVGVTTTVYAYDGDGVRASKTVSGTTTNFVYDLNRSLPVVLDDGERKYVWGLGLAYSVDVTGTVAVYHVDGLGPVRAMSNPSAEVVQTYQTDEFGVPTQTQGSFEQPFQYTGEQRDGESGFYYLRARMYDPAVGRFASRDPLRGYVEDPQTLHRYTYAANNPVLLTDPSGLLVVPPRKNSLLSKDPLVIAGVTSNNPLGIVPVAGILAARQLGNIGEAAAGILKNWKHIPSSTPGVAYRVPDIWDKGAKVVGDVKNMAYLRLTGQLQDILAFAEHEGYTMKLIVRQDTATTLSKALQGLEKAGRIIVERALPHP